MVSMNPNTLSSHPAILPSFAISFIVKPMDSPVGLISRQEFIAWTKPQRLSDHSATLIAHHFVKARRNTFDRILESVINIDIHDDWRLALTPKEITRFLPLIVEGRESFKCLTLQRVKSDTKLPVVTVLRVLAKLESLHWQDGPLDPKNRSYFQPRVAVPKGFQEDVAACLASAWVKQIKHDDLRFPDVGDLSFRDWLIAETQSEELTQDAHIACLLLLKAHKASWAEELLSLATHLGQKAFPRTYSQPELLERYIKIFISRYGGISGLELERVGEAVGLTRERIRQICARLLNVLGEHTVQLPALTNVFSVALRVAPMPVSEANTQLAKYLGKGSGLEAALKLAVLVGVDPGVKIEDSRSRTLDGYSYVPMVYAMTDKPEWANAALSLARRDCTSIGCTNYPWIAGLMALQGHGGQEFESIKSLFECSHGFRLLDQDSGWFTLSDNDTSSAALRMKKMMSVCDGVTSLNSVASALITDERRSDRSATYAAAIPPPFVLAVLFSGWPWLTANKHNIYTTKEELNPEDFLSNTELSAWQFLKSKGGAATRVHLTDHVIKDVNVSAQAVNAVLANSPIIHKLEHGIFGIRGWPVPAEAIIKIRNDRVLSRRRYSDSGILNDGVFEMRQPTDLKAQNKRRVLYVPSHTDEKYVGQYFHADDRLKAIRINAQRQAHHVANSAETLGIAPGSTFFLTLDVESMTYDIASAAPNQQNLLQP